MVAVLEKIGLDWTTPCSPVQSAVLDGPWGALDITKGVPVAGDCYLDPQSSRSVILSSRGIDVQNSIMNSVNGCAVYTSVFTLLVLICPSTPKIYPETTGASGIIGMVFWLEQSKKKTSVTVIVVVGSCCLSASDLN